MTPLLENIMYSTDFANSRRQLQPQLVLQITNHSTKGKKAKQSYKYSETWA